MPGRTTTVPFPIWSHSGQYFGHLDFVDVEVPSVIGKESPVVLEWRQGAGRPPHRDVVHEFRGFEGRLYSTVCGVVGPHIDDLAQSARKSAFGQRVEGIAGQVLLSGQMQPAYNYHDVRSVSARSPLEDEARAWVRSSIVGLETDLLVVEGRLWIASNGPVLEAKWSKQENRHPPFMINAAAESSRHVDRSSMMMSAARLDESVELLAEYFGEVSVEGNPTIVLDSSFDFGHAIECSSVERAVWHFLWETRNIGLSSKESRRLSAVVLEAREVLSARWPGVQLRFDARLHSDVATHLHRRMPPPVDDLVPLLERIVDESRGAHSEALVRNWGFALHRARAGLQRNARANVETSVLDDFSI